MKTCRLFVAIALSALAVSCSDKASVSGTLEGAGGKQLILKRLDVSHYKVLDTLTTSSSGAWSYSLKVEQGHPQFLYAFYGEQKVASLLVSPGERIKLVSDTLGHYSVRGSGESERLRQVEADFSKGLLSSSTPIGKALIGHTKGDVVEAQAPGGTMKFKILDISL